MEPYNEDEYPVYTPVRHKTQGYTGWIYDTTTSKSFFTGNTDCRWQYRVWVGDEDIRIAPLEDLEINDRHPPLPVEVKKKIGSSTGFRKETELHALGYHLTDTSQEERADILLKVAVPYLGVYKVVKTIANLIYGRLKAMRKNRNALYEWSYDLDRLLRRYDYRSSLFDRDLIQYIMNIKKKLRNNQIEMDISLKDIEDEFARRKKAC
jgi:hypothetical protein